MSRPRTFQRAAGRRASAAARRSEYRTGAVRGSGDALDDRADADRPAIAQQRHARCFRQRRGIRADSAIAGDAGAGGTASLRGARPGDAGARGVGYPDDAGYRHHRFDSDRLRRCPSSSARDRFPTEKLPDAIGGPALRAAAMKGDPAAAYEIGVRFAEGHGVPSNFDEAAKWYERAAQAGLVPAIFRLGTFYERA